MKRFLKPIALMLYYVLAKRFPTQPVPGYRLGYALRGFLVKHIFEECGRNVIIKQNAYFGKGNGIRLGDNSQIGERSYVAAFTKIGRDVIMGPEVAIWSVSHRFDRTDIPINRQSGTEPRPVEIGDDVWIGQRVIIMPGIKVGSHAVIGAGAIVTKDVPEWAVVAGVPAKVIRLRK
jgi:maltose O-acetyltransferase